MRDMPPDLEAALLGKQAVFVRGPLDDATANTVIAQLLLVSRVAAGRPVDMYIDSPGGSMSGALSVYDMMQTVGVPVSTTCVGTAGGPTVLLLAGGTKGRRFALPHARVHLQEESVSLMTQRATNVESSAANVKAQSVRWRTTLLKHLTHAPENVVESLSAPRWLTAQEARQLGIIDAVVTSPRA